MKSPRVFALLLSVSLSSTLAYGAPVNRRPAERLESKPRSIDDLQEDVYKTYKSKKAAQLKKAYDSFLAGKYAAAKSGVSSLMDDSQFGDYARWIAAESELAHAQDLTRKKKIVEARKHAQSVVSALTPLQTRYPYSPFGKWVPRQLAQAEFILGRAKCAGKKWQTCSEEFEKGLQRVIGTADMAYLRPEDVATYAEACSKNKTEVCSSWVLRLAQFYPKLTEEFKALVGFFPEYKDKTPRPPGNARLNQSYRSPDPDTTAIEEAMALYLDGKNKNAIDAFRRFGDEYPRSQSRHRARFWLAQALKKDGKKEDAAALFQDIQKSSPLTYYGMLAALELGSDLESLLTPDVPLAADFDPFLYPSEIHRLRRAQNLIAQKAYELAAIELRDFRPRDAHSSYFLCYLAMLHAESKSYVTAFPILNELIARGHAGALTSYFSKMVFPLVHFPLVKKYAEDHKLDPLLVLSLMKQESSFDTIAASPVGAMGLMQLMPTTAVDTVAGIARADLLSAETNVKTGTLYLSKLMSRFQGNIVLATAGYNAGPGVANRWFRAAPPGRPMLEFIESIPYKETREYVASIIRNYFWYSKRLNPESTKKLTLDFFWHNYGPQVTMEAAEPESLEQVLSSEEGNDSGASPKPASLEIPEVKTDSLQKSKPVPGPTPGAQP